MNFNIRMGIPEMQELWLDLQEKYRSGNIKKKEEQLYKKWGKDLKLLAVDPSYPSLQTHSFLFLLTMLCSRMKSKGHVLVPFVTVGEEMFSDLDVYNLKEGDTLTLDHDVRLHMDTVTEGCSSMSATIS